MLVKPNFFKFTFDRIIDASWSNYDLSRNIEICIDYIKPWIEKWISDKSRVSEPLSFVGNGKLKIDNKYMCYYTTMNNTACCNEYIIYWCKDDGTPIKEYKIKIIADNGKIKKIEVTKKGKF